MSKIRIQNEHEKDQVVIDLKTGAVDLLDPSGETITEAAITWWRTVAATYESVSKAHGGTYKDLVFRAPGKGDEKDGSIILRPAPADADFEDKDITIIASLPCPECGGDPRGVLLLDLYHPCKRCEAKSDA